MPDRHALLGPSSAHRWLACPPSARLGEGCGDTGSIYAEEGTLAHKLAELTLRQRFEGADITAELAEVEADPLYSPAMLEHINDYADFVAERMADAKTRCGDPRLYVEQEVDFGEYVPEGFGTSDAVIIADGIMDVIDLKYGAGVTVDAADNPQMKIYALGCLLAFGWIYRIEAVRMTIFQPRKDNISTATLSADSLMAWAKGELKSKAQLAWEGGGEFNPGEKQCKWCPVAATCRARAQHQMELAKLDFTEPPLLTPEEVAQVLARLPDLLDWADGVKTYALEQALNKGAHYPGFKVVEGISRRKYADEDAIAAALRKAGYKVADIYKPKALLGLTDMEKRVGKKRFGELAGAYLVKPAGAPTLVPESDKRPELNTADQAAADFADADALAPAT